MASNMMIQACKDYLCKLLVYGILFCQLNITETFNWTAQPINPTPAIKGQDVSLAWNYSLTADELLQSQTHFVIFWKKLNQSTLNYDKIGTKSFLKLTGITYAEPQAPRIVIDKSDQATLHIKDLRKEDDGTYKIEFILRIDGSVLAEQRVNLTVLEHPELDYASNDQDVCEDSMVTLYCNATGKPAPNINWTRVWENGTDSEQLPVVDGSYVMSNIKKSSSGTYRCTAYNGVGAFVNSTVKVSVRYSASVVRVVKSTDTVIEGDTFILTCEVSGDPTPNVTWITVSNNEHSYGNIRNFTNITRGDSGDYRCETRNKCGKESRNESINVLYGPENVILTTNTTSKVCTGVVINFTCTAEANPPVHTYLLYENDSMVKNMGISRTWIKTMENAGHFVFRCEANNSIQGIGKSGNTTLTVDVPASVKQVENKNVIEGDNLKEYCNLTAGIPNPTVMWLNVTSGEHIKGNPLNIANINRAQAGEYKCTANNTCGEASTVMNINVQYQPDDVYLTTNATDKVCLGIIINFTCSAEANPAVHTYLLYENDTVIYNMALGTVIRTMENAGQFVFRCEANNSVQDTGRSSDTILTVVAPIATVKQAENKITVEGTDIEVYCNVTGIPDPIVIWRNVKSDENSEGNLLNITNITRAQAGEYKCTANSTCGVDSTIVNIDVQYPPAITSEGHTIHVSEGSPGSVCCPVIGNPHPTIKWYRRNEATPSTVISSNNMLQFSKTVLDDSGWYTCFAENYLGNITATVQLRVEKSVQTTVTTLPKPTTKAVEECKCSCNDVILTAVVGVLVFIIIGLIFYIIWLHKKGTAGEQRLYKEERGVYDNEMALDDLQPSSHIQSKSTQSRSEYMDITEATKDNEETQPVTQSTDYAPLHPSTRSWEVEKQHVTIEKVIGKGAFGQVAKGTATGLLGRPGKTTVAVKMLKYNCPESDRRDLLRELDTMKQLKPHCHVIKLLGCVTETEPLMVIIEYVPYGDLLGYLRKSRGLNDTYYKDPDIKPQTSLNSQQLMKFAWEIADGMSYLSSKSIIHRDLAARNVLVGERETCKVTDFGMARDVQQDNIYEKKTKGRLPVKWTAYEALLYGTYTTKSDIWSYGVVLYEIFTIGGSPYPRVNGKRIASLLQEGYRMPKPQHVDDKLYEIMLKCWQNDPDVRPTFSELKNQLKDMENQHKRLINLKMYDHRQLYANVEDLME